MAEKLSEFSIVIDPQSIQKEYFKDLYRYRELLYYLIWRDIIVRYKQALLGVAWAVIRPLLTMAVFAFIFGSLAGLSSKGINYSLFVLVGLFPWLLFATSLTDASFCMTNNTYLINKVYFPRIILLISSIVVNLLDFLIGFGFVVLLLVFTGFVASWKILFLPLFILQAVFLCLGMGLWFSAMTVRFRDLRFILQFIVQFGLFISPVGYDSSNVPEKLRLIYSMNPMVGIIDGFRWAVFGISSPNFILSIGLSLAIIAALFFSGFIYFRKMERTISDVI